MNNIKIKNKGFITLNDKVMVSDPCYGMETWCQGVVNNVLKGNYNCTVEIFDAGEWGKRVSAIQIVHENYVEKFLEYYKENFEVGVDSAQAGIFDYEYYTQYHSNAKDSKHVNEDWYWKVCNFTYGDGNTIDGLGFVSASGYGDGGYDCWTAHNDDGKVIAIRVEYITEDEEDM